MTDAAIISIGNELISGHVLNSNSSYIADILNRYGIRVRLIITVGDDSKQIIDVLENLNQHIKIVLITGGLGPTHDDLTVPALAEFFRTKLIFKKEIADNIATRFTLRGLEMPEVNLKQAYIPQNAQILNNPVGSAPGLKIEHDGRIYYVMPGVPAEMQAIMEKVILPEFDSIGKQNILKKIIHVTGLPESQIYTLLKDWIKQHPSIEVAFLPQTTHIDVALTISDHDEIAQLDDYIKHITAILGRNIYGYDDDNLESVIARLLFEKHLTLAVAESCTGGLIASRLTDIPGSSAYFKSGIIAYSNSTKIKLLGVKREIIANFGAVSSEVAGQMAEQVRAISGCDIGLSSTGIAGPSGGSEEKPVGLVWIGISDKNGSRSFSHNFAGNRLTNKLRFSQAALNHLRLALIEDFSK
ncbi:MAG: competence/damage-inducible protein A [Candidatus Marinimicrobia bacterium]|nr:competence/damage-inducible protein A [Candidatus Neomarinimicrobiota bacterium]MCK9558892.1 competence/damage-inducible protein A [Candidatus Neomarinimicrobiota bacterium]